MNPKKISPKLIVGILLALFIGISLYLRIYLPYKDIFVGDWIKFSSNDAYYYMRIIDNLAHNFPHLNHFDPYLIYPGGSGIGSILFFGWLIAGVTWVIGLGSPTQHTIDVVGAYFPAIMAALTIIPVYFIGKNLFSRWAGAVAAALVAIMPGEFLGRSILAFTDHHVAETLFTTIAMLFLVLAIKSAGQTQLTFSHLKSRDWAASTKTLVYALLAGVSLGIYLITWLGGLLFVFIVTVYLIIQFNIDHLRRRSTDYLAITGVVPIFIALIIVAPFVPGTLILAAMLIALLVPLLLSAISRLMAARQLKPGYYPLVVIAAGAVGLGILYAAAPSLLSSMLESFSMFSPSGPSLTTLEMQRFLFPGGTFSWGLAWGNFPGLSSVLRSSGDIYTKVFTVAGVLFVLASLGILVYIVAQHDSSSGLYLIWGEVLLIAFVSFLRLSNVYLLLAMIVILVATIIYLAIRRGWSDIGFTATCSLIIVAVIMSLLGLGSDSGFTVNGLAAALTSTFFFGIAAWLIMVYLVIRHGSGDRTLMVVWSLVIFAATLAQRRFAYYLAVNVALLTGYLSWQAIWHAGLKNVLGQPGASAETVKEKHGRTKRKRGTAVGSTVYLVCAALEIIVIFFFVLFPNLPAAKNTARQARFAPSDAWCSALTWLKDNSPDPFGNPDYYYQLYQTPKPGETYSYPASAYGVTAWWDYGYWITRIAHRLPSTNPSQEAQPIINVTRLFLSQNESAAQKTVQDLDSRYVIIDNPTVTSKFWAIITWAGRPQSDFFDDYYLPPQKVFVRVYFPEYYRSMSSRLYNFDAKAVTPANTIVISWEDRQGQGVRYKEITDAQAFSDYNAAVGYVEGQKPGNHRIVGNNPFVSPVPLEALKDYKLVYSSANTVGQAEVAPVPEVKVFEYTGARAGPAQK